MTMLEWVQQVLGSPAGAAALPVVFILGVAGSVTSCCTLPVLGAVAGFSGSLGSDRRDVLLCGMSFLVGTVLALSVMGAVTGFIGQVAGAALGTYWKLAAGLIIVFFGLVSLGMVPFRIPGFGLRTPVRRRGFASTMIYGLAVGGGTTTCSVGCNPLLPLVLGYTTVEGSAAWGAALLFVFALGYSLPLAAALVGLGLGLRKLGHVVSRAAPVVRIAAGVVLIVVGFYLLATV